MFDNSVKLWRGLVILLTLLNISLLISFWLKPNHGRLDKVHEMHKMPSGKNDHNGPGEMLIRELQFNPDQVDEFIKLRDEHRKSIRELQVKGHQLRDQFFDQLKMENVNSKNVNQIADSIAANQRSIEITTFHHFQKVRTICSEEQKKIFDDIINEVTKQMGQTPMKPGDGPPPPHS